VFRSSRLVICVVFLYGSMANNRKQGFRLVRANTLCLVWGGVLTFKCLALTTGRLQAVRMCECGRERERRRPSSALYMWWAGLHFVREGVYSPHRSAALHISCSGPESGRALPFAKVKSGPSDPRHRLTRPRSYWPSPWQGMAPSSLLRASRMRGGWASRQVGRLQPTLRQSGGRAPRLRWPSGSWQGPLARRACPPKRLMTEGYLVRSATSW
jgi:hypothetical protein